MHTPYAIVNTDSYNKEHPFVVSGVVHSRRDTVLREYNEIQRVWFEYTKHPS